ncbi:MAG TPA: ATP synthase subunit I [Gammaproteobacteria bacterium]|jgi:ATP synthase protein I|nr:ATP synthase subunit I [Gammaproteobacteria bacterium]
MPAPRLKKIIQKEAFSIVINQIMGVLLLTLAAILLKDLRIGGSVLAGGLAYVLPNLFFVFWVFRYTGAHQMNKFVAAFFAGEAIKLFLSGILFLYIVKYLPVSLLSVLVGFVGAIISFWIACIVHFLRK